MKESKSRLECPHLTLVKTVSLGMIYYTCLRCGMVFVMEKVEEKL
jgi:hypothetical protein